MYLSNRSLPKQVPEEIAVIPGEYEFVADENVVPDLSGTFYGPSSNLMVGMDCCVYCEEVESRPWLGRILRLYPETSEFDIHWYKEGNKIVFTTYSLNLTFLKQSYSLFQ